MSDLVLLVNPTSGRGRARRLVDPIADRLPGARVIAEPTAAATSTALKDALHNGIGGVVVLGGDGLVHLALQEVAGTDIPLGIVPAGTGNDIAAALGIPADPVAAAALIGSSSPRPVDAVRSEPASGASHTVRDDDGQWWLSVLCAGFDSAINERANRIRWPRGPRRYDIAIFTELALLHPYEFRLTVDDTEWSGPAILVAVGNTERYGGGYRMCAGADPYDGLLDITIVRPVGRLDLVRMLPKVKSGEHLNHPAVTVLRGREVTIEATGVSGYADGERLGELPRTARCESGAVKIWTPTR